MSSESPRGRAAVAAIETILFFHLSVLGYILSCADRVHEPTVT